MRFESDARPLPPEGTPAERRWALRMATRGTFWVLLPFLIALLLTFGESLHGMQRATLSLTAMARRAGAGEPAAAAGDAGAGERRAALAGAVARRVRELEESPTLGAAGSSRIERLPLLGTGFCPRGDDVASRFCRVTYPELWSDAWAILFGKAMLILFFPVLLVSSLWQAWRDVVAPPGLLAGDGGRRFASFPAEIRYRRHRRYLADQERSFFVRRAAFAMLMTYGIAYVVAPLGHQAMAIGDFAQLHAAPGAPTYPFLFDAFDRAPLFSVGFAGFLVFALGRFMRRFNDGDLQDRVLLSLFLRGLTVLLLTFVLPSVGEQDILVRPLVFAIGMIPRAGFDLIAKVTKVKADEVAGDENAGFTAIPEIDLWKESSLHELGIHDLHDLAKEDLPELLTRIGANPSVMLQAADRAVLHHVLGTEAAAKLAAIPLGTASELALWASGNGAAPAERAERERALAARLGFEDLRLKLEELLADRNVRYVLEKRAAYGGL